MSNPTLAAVVGSIARRQDQRAWVYADDFSREVSKGTGLPSSALTIQGLISQGGATAGQALGSNWRKAHRPGHPTWWSAQRTRLNDQQAAVAVKQSSLTNKAYEVADETKAGRAANDSFAALAAKLYPPRKAG